MKTLPQIAFDFSAPAAEPQLEPSPVAPKPQLQDAPVNVGFRVKALKQVIMDEPEIVPEEEKPLQKKSTRGRKSIREVAAEADLILIPEDEILFQKQYYTMGEVAEMFRVNHSLLRFWEAEFDIIQPKKNKKGDRYFRPIDIKNLHLVYNLLRQRKFTIEGAKDFLKKNKKADERFEMIKKLEQIRGFLLEMKAQL